MKLVNRGIAVVKPGPLFVSWLNSIPREESSAILYTLEDVQRDCNTLLLPDLVSRESLAYILEPLKPQLFEMVLAEWCQDQSRWPEDRSTYAFDRWFTVEFHSMVWDLLDLHMTWEEPVSTSPAEPMPDPELEVPFKRGQTVRVLTGVYDRSDPRVELSGWCGRVLDFFPGQGSEVMALVEWDSFTLQSMPETYLKERDEQSWEWESSLVAVTSLESIEPRDNPTAVEIAQSWLAARHFWMHLPGPGHRIARVLLDHSDGDADTPLERWKNYLTTALVHPFEACATQAIPEEALLKGDFLTVTSLAGSDPTKGVLVRAQVRENEVIVPLSNLEVLNSTSANAQTLNDYKLWFSYAS